MLTPVARSPWTIPILRVGMGLFLAAWGIDKLLAAEGSQAIFSRFYGVDAGPVLVRAAGVGEIVIAVLLIADWWRVPVVWMQLAMNLVSAFGSWRQILDPWGLLGFTQGGTHLFLASIVVTAVSIVLVLNARDDVAELSALGEREAFPPAPRNRTTPDTGR